MINKWPYQIKQLSLSLGLIFLFMATPLSAEETDSNDWQIDVAPYLWAIGMDGETGVGELDLDISFDIFDILDALRWVAMARASATKNDWTFYTDGFFASLGGNNGTTKGVGPFEIGRSFPRTVGPFAVPIDVEIEMRMDMVELGTRYHVGDWGYGSAGRKWSLSFLAGVRYAKVGSSILLGSTNQIKDLQ